MGCGSGGVAAPGHGECRFNRRFLARTGVTMLESLVLHAAIVFAPSSITMAMDMVSAAVPGGKLCARVGGIRQLGRHVHYGASPGPEHLCSMKP